MPSRFGITILTVLAIAAVSLVTSQHRNRHDFAMEQPTPLRPPPLVSKTTSIPKDPLIVESKIVTSMKQLEFVHITKTGGTVIETTAANHGILWGACHYVSLRKTNCTSPDWIAPSSIKAPLSKRFSSVPWHVPPHWMTPNPMDGYDTFTVVRNPYDRYVSEYHCAYFGYKGDDRNDATVMNDWIQQKINSPIQSGHMLPQHYFVMDEQGQQQVTHILDYEALGESFVTLMNQYGMDMQIPRLGKNEKTLTRLDLSDDTIQSINEYAAMDFDLFGYMVVHSANEF